MTTIPSPATVIPADSDPGPTPYDATYMLPPAIVAALMTNRSQLLKTVDPDTLSRPHIVELLRLLGDMLEDRHRVKRREDNYRFRIRELSKALGGFQRILDELGEADLTSEEED